MLVIFIKLFKISKKNVIKYNHIIEILLDKNKTLVRIFLKSNKKIIIQIPKLLNSLIFNKLHFVNFQILNIKFNRVKFIKLLNNLNLKKWKDKINN